MNLLKKGLLGLVLVLSLTACSTSTTDVEDDATVVEDMSLQNILDAGTLIVGFTDYPPMGFMIDGEATGFDLDIAKEVVARLGIDAEFVYIDWDAKVMELNSGSIDVIWNGLTITEDRKKEILFSKPYFDNRVVMMTLSGSEVNAISDLAGLKVGVELQSSGQLALEENAVFADINEMVKFTTISEARLALETNQIDVIVADEIFARYAVSTDPSSYRVADEVFSSENYGIGFRLEDVALRDRIDEIIDEIAADGTGSEISTTWFGEDLLKR